MKRVIVSTPEHIARDILVLRGQRVIVDSDLAALYGVTTKRFNEQVRRNRERFPEDFMFQLTAQEAAALRSQFATIKTGRGQHRKYLPYAFTEHGAIMAASVLNSPRAVEMSVYVVRAFVRLREMLASNRELARQFAQLEVAFAHAKGWCELRHADVAFEKIAEHLVRKSGGGGPRNGVALHTPAVS
jgi:phage regulator Rha-like protein